MTGSGPLLAYVRGRSVEHIISNPSTASPWFHTWCGNSGRRQRTDEPVLDVCKTCIRSRDAFMRLHSQETSR